MNTSIMILSRNTIPAVSLDDEKPSSPSSPGHRFYEVLDSASIQTQDECLRRQIVKIDA